MRPATRAAVFAAAGLAIVGGVAAGWTLRTADARQRAERTARIWRLTVRRGAHYAVVQVRGRAADDARRAELEKQFTIRSAEDVARELGQMKGAIMKAGQMLSFIADGLPPEAQAALATLQADVPPMAPSLAEQVVGEELGDRPDRLFLDWEPVPIAAASVGQVHRAVLPDGRRVAVKVQYPGVASAIHNDLDNAEMLYSLFSSFAMKGLDTTALVDELRARMSDELDYTLEAASQREFADRYAGHPFIRVPAVVPERSSRRVLTTEWADGMAWADFLAVADESARQRAAEIIFRFAQGSVHGHRVFNGDPHPGNYRFARDGSVTFLDFGLVKRWSGDEFERLDPCMDAILAHDAARTVQLMIGAGFLAADHGLDPEKVWGYVSRPYVPYLERRFAFTPAFTQEALTALLDLTGPYKDVIGTLNMPPSFVILDRVVWGVSALLGKLGAVNNWRGILEEYRHGAPPCTPLGESEAAWKSGSAA